MAKKIDSYIKLQVKMGSANPSPPVGPVLGQRGVNIMEFCKTFNAQSSELVKEHEKTRKTGETKFLETGMPVPVKITVYSDKSFTFMIKTPPASVLLRKVAGLAKGSPNPNTVKVATLTVAQLDEIARFKQPDLTAASVNAAIRTLAGTARSMGIVVNGIEALAEAEG